MTGFCLAWDGQVRGELYLSGDTVLFAGVRQVAEKRTVSVAVLNLGAARFKASGPLRYTMDAAEGVRAAVLLKAPTVIPNHFDGFTHLRQSAAEARPIFEAAGVPARWILPGQSEEIEV